MRVFLFDIDGTLLSSGGAGKAAMEAALAREFGVTELRGQVPYSGRTDRAIVRDLFRLHDIEESPHHWQRFMDTYLRGLPGFLTNYQGRVLPGIAELLQHLASLDQVALGLLTGNVREGARLKLGHYQLARFFKFGGFGDHHWERDDVAHEALAEVRRHLNGQVRLDRIWVIGDTPLDVRCARSIGVRVAAVATGWHSCAELEAERPDLVLTDLSDHRPLLDLCG
jgi:phosphoglycolate phosphatase-like HAD superfamily hydrolase